MQITNSFNVPKLARGFSSYSEEGRSLKCVSSSHILSHLSMLTNKMRTLARFIQVCVSVCCWLLWMQVCRFEFSYPVCPIKQLTALQTTPLFPTCQPLSPFNHTICFISTVWCGNSNKWRKRSKGAGSVPADSPTGTLPANAATGLQAAVDAVMWVHPGLCMLSWPRKKPQKGTQSLTWQALCFASHTVCVWASGE